MDFAKGYTKLGEYAQALHCLQNVELEADVQGKYSGSPHITDKHMRFSPPPANASGGYTLI